jgi:hypothetical protein
MHTTWKQKKTRETEGHNYARRPIRGFSNSAG